MIGVDKIGQIRHAYFEQGGHSLALLGMSAKCV
jgi:hypothetical protein